MWPENQSDQATASLSVHESVATICSLENGSPWNVYSISCCVWWLFVRSVGRLFTSKWNQVQSFYMEHRWRAQKCRQFLRYLIKDNMKITLILHMTCIRLWPQTKFQSHLLVNSCFFLFALLRKLLAVIVVFCKPILFVVVVVVFLVNWHLSHSSLFWYSFQLSACAAEHFSSSNFSRRWWQFEFIQDYFWNTMKVKLLVWLHAKISVYKSSNEMPEITILTNKQKIYWRMHKTVVFSLVVGTWMEVGGIF